MGQFNKKLEDHPFYVFDETEAALGWAYDVDEGICGCRPDNEFFDYLEFAYVKAIDDEQYASGFLSLPDELYPCFTFWIGNFIDDWHSFLFISRAIIDRYDREEKIDRSLAVVNLKKSLRITLQTVFRYLDEKVAANFGEEELYAKYLISYLKLRSFFLDENHLLYSFREDVLKELLLRKDLYQEIVTFNKLSKTHKFNYESFRISLEQQKTLLRKVDKNSKVSFKDIVKNDVIKKFYEQVIPALKKLKFKIEMKPNATEAQSIIYALIFKEWVDVRILRNSYVSALDLKGILETELGVQFPHKNVKPLQIDWFSETNLKISKNEPSDFLLKILDIIPDKL